MRPRRNTSWTSRLPLLLALLLLPGAALAQSMTFEQRLDRAILLYQANRLQESIEEFRVAYAMRPVPEIYYNMARAYQKLGDKKLALRLFEQYLEKDKAPPPEVKAKAGAAIEELRAQIAADERPPEPAPPPPPRIEAPPPPAAPPRSGAAQTFQELTHKWWFWTAVGGGFVATALVVGLSVGLSQRDAMAMEPQALRGLTLYRVSF